MPMAIRRTGWRQSLYHHIGRAERVHGPHRSVEPVMLKILREDFRDSVVFGISRKVRMEAAQLVSGACGKGLTHDRFIGIRNHELAEELFRFTQGVRSLEDDMAANGTGGRCHELDYRLMRQK